MSWPTRLWIFVLVLEALWSLVTLAAPDFYWMSLVMDSEEPQLNRGTVLLLRWLQIQTLAGCVLGLLTCCAAPTMPRTPFWLLHLLRFAVLAFVLRKHTFLLLAVEFVQLWVAIGADLAAYEAAGAGGDVYVAGYSHKMLEIYGFLSVILVLASCIVVDDFLKRLDATGNPQLAVFILLMLQLLFAMCIVLMATRGVQKLEFTMMIAASQGLTCFTTIFFYGLGDNLPESTAAFSMVDLMAASNFASGIGFLAALLVDLLPLVQ